MTVPVRRDPLTSFQTVFPRQFSDAASRVLHVHNQLRSFERMPAQRQDQLLSGQLNNLLAHAKRHTRFWNKRLSAWTPRPRQPDRILQQIEPLTRKDLQDNFSQLSAEFKQREAFGVTEGSSSGSTGTPVRFERSSLIHAPLYFAALMRSYRWHHIDPKKPLGVVGTRCTDKERAPLGVPFSWLGPVATGFERCTRNREISDIYDYCAERNPAYLQAGPTLLTSLARYAIDKRRNELRPKLALTLGSVVTDEIRDYVREGLGAKIIDRYSSEETGYIAIQCPKHDHLHVLTPITYMEIVDDEGNACPVGKPGRVLLTSMQSYAMPLIRYEIGDMAEWAEPCDCGIRLPVVKKLWGRTRHLITNPDGNRTYARIYARDFEKVPGLIEYRIVLHQNAVIVAQVKFSKRSEAAESMVVELVQKALNYPYPVRLRHVDEIDWGKSWKQEYFGVSDAPALL